MQTFLIQHSTWALAAIVLLALGLGILAFLYCKARREIVENQKNIDKINELENQLKKYNILLTQMRPFYEREKNNEAFSRNILEALEKNADKVIQPDCEDIPCLKSIQEILQSISGLIYSTQKVGLINEGCRKMNEVLAKAQKRAEIVQLLRREVINPTHDKIKSNRSVQWRQETLADIIDAYFKVEDGICSLYEAYPDPFDIQLDVLRGKLKSAEAESMATEVTGLLKDNEEWSIKLNAILQDLNLSKERVFLLRGKKFIVESK